MSGDNSFLSLFSGAGGLDLGLEKAGWQCSAQVDCDPDSVETLRRRTKNTRNPIPVFESTIENLDTSKLVDSLGLGGNQLPLLAGGPPCQPFTTSGLRQTMRDRRASKLFPAYLRIIEILQPKRIVIENVDGLLSAALRHRPLKHRTKEYPPLQHDERKGSFLLWLLTELATLGYSVTWGVLEAADYGVPQFRQRAILIGSHWESSPALPAPTYGGENQPNFRTLREAISAIKELGAIQPLSQKKRDVYAQIPAGGNWRNLPEHVQRETMGAAFNAEGGKSGWWRRLAWDEPSPTILGMPDHSSTALVHPDKLRCLSVRECAVIQGFPLDTEFAGNPRSQYQQIGNAVPVQLGEAIGRSLMSGSLVEDQAISKPEWRQASANRRIGIHGWVVPGYSGSHKFHILAKSRSDHVWVGKIRGHERITIS